MKEISIAILILSSLFFGETLAQSILYPNCGITISPPTDLELVYTDQGTDADMDLSVWKPIPPQGYYNLGYIFQRGYGKPTTAVNGSPIFVVKEKTPESLLPPIGWAWIWNDAGSGGARDGSVWTPICPDHYVALGSVAVHVENGINASNEMFPDIRCVHTSFALLDKIQATERWEQGEGKFVREVPIYADNGSGASLDLSVWGVRSTSFAFGFRDYAKHDGEPAWRLRTNEC